jgi:hypothetical protein
MSTTVRTSDVMTDQKVVLGRVWWVGFVTIIATLVVNFLIASIAKGLFPIANTFIPLQPMGFISFTIIGVLAAIIVFALIGRFARRPISTFERTAWIVLTVSLIPDVLVWFTKPYPGTTLPGVVALMVMHIATATICINLLTRLSRVR